MEETAIRATGRAERTTLDAKGASTAWLREAGGKSALFELIDTSIHEKSTYLSECKNVRDTKIPRDVQDYVVRGVGQVDARHGLVPGKVKEEVM